MASLTVTKSYADSILLTKTDLDNICDSLETFFNITKVSDDNIATASLTANEILADNSIETSKILNSAVTAAKLANNSITTDKITDANVTNDKIADGAVTTAKIAAGAVTAAKIATGAVTPAKKEAANYDEASNTTGVTLATTAIHTDVDTGLSVSITTTGRPVIITLMDESNSSTVAPARGVNTYNFRGTTLASALSNIALVLYKDGSPLFTTTTWDHRNYSGASTVSNNTQAAFVPGAYTWIDTPAVGTYTYSLYLHAATESGVGSWGLHVSDDRTFRGPKLIALELF